MCHFAVIRHSFDGSSRLHNSATVITIVINIIEICRWRRWALNKVFHFKCSIISEKCHSIWQSDLCQETEVSSQNFWLERQNDMTAVTWKVNVGVPSGGDGDVFSKVHDFRANFLASSETQHLPHLSLIESSLPLLWISWQIFTKCALIRPHPSQLPRNRITERALRFHFEDYTRKQWVSGRLMFAYL